jgi:hypothetical protein
LISEIPGYNKILSGSLSRVPLLSLRKSAHLYFSTMPTTISTTKLGQIRGKSGDGVTQYLGIKYATLANRFADAQLIEERHGDVLDATKDG